MNKEERVKYNLLKRDLLHMAEFSFSQQKKLEKGKRREDMFSKTRWRGLEHAYKMAVNQLDFYFKDLHISKRELNNFLSKKSNKYLEEI